MTQLEPLWRGAGRYRQADFHLKPVWVEGGDESLVLTATGKLGASEPVFIDRISSFLGVMPGDEVEMAVDVVSDEGLVLYARSIHKECRGIYDAWHTEVLGLTAQGLTVTVTCRVNGPNRDGALRAYFEGLVRIGVER